MPNESAKIILAATHGKLTKVRDCLLIEDSINSIQCQFEFRTSDWDNTTKTAVFFRGWATPSTPDADTVYVILDESNTCYIPSEILNKNTLFSVGVFGISDDYRIVSNWMYYKIKDGCFAEGSSPSGSTPSAYEQLLKQLENHQHNDMYYTKDESEDRFVSQEEINNLVATPDWNQNDESANDYIKNRTHYTEISKKLATSGTWTLSTEGGTDLIIVSSTGLQISEFIQGDVYELICINNTNGNSYITKMRAVSDSIITARILDNFGNVKEQVDPNNSDLRIEILNGTLNIITATDCMYLSGTSDVTLYHINERIHKLDLKYLPGMQITPINQDGNMTAEDFMSLSDGLYFFYSGPFDYTYGLVGILNGYWACYDYGYYYVDIKNDNGVLVADREGSLDGFGYAESDYLLSRIFPTDIQEGQTIVAYYNEDGDIIFNASDFPKGITHVNMDGSMTPEEFRSLEDGIYIFDKGLELIGYQNTSTQVYGYVFYYKDSSGNFSADCISTLTHISPYYGTFYITSLIPSDVINEEELNTMLEEVLV